MSDQKKYLVQLKLGEVYSKEEEKIEAWEKGHNLIPERLECLHRIVKYYRDKNNYGKALEWAKKATNWIIKEDFLQPEEIIYQCGFDIDYAMVAYYAGEYRLAYDINRANMKKNINRRDNNFQKMMENQKYYDEKIKTSDVSKVIPQKEVSTHKTIQRTPELFTQNEGNLDQSGDSSCIKNRFSPDIRPNIIIVDGFYENPDEVRRMALNADYNVRGNYPGIRTKSYATDFLKSRFENIIGKKIVFWPNEYNGSFQYTTKDQVSWIHRDKTDYSGIVYMSPNAPANSGTVLYRHLATGKQFANDEVDEKILSHDSNNYNAWEIMDIIGNKYNRCILFNGRLSHKSNEYFGNCLENGRLFQTFFFDTEK